MDWSGVPALVTGGGSFIGSHLVEELVRRGAAVRVADDFSSGSIGNLSKVVDRIEVYEGDLRDRAVANKAMEDIEVVFHLAAAHGGRGFIDTHPADCATNLVLDGTVFHAALNSGVDRLCFASSACVYPTNLQDGVNHHSVLLREDMADPFREGAAFADREYGWAKLMGEMSLGAAYRQYGFKSVICRLFRVYGPRENETHAIVALIAKAFVGMDPFEIWGSGEQERAFVYVDDVVQGLVLAAEKVTDATPVNLGSPDLAKLRSVAETILQLTGFQPRDVHYERSKPVGVHTGAADMGRASAVLGWTPRTKLREGLRRTADWYFATHDREKVRKTLPLLLTERRVT